MAKITIAELTAQIESYKSQSKSWKRNFWVALSAVVVGVIIILILMFSKPKPVVVSNESELRRSYDVILKSKDDSIAAILTQKVEVQKERDYYRNSAKAKDVIISNNQKLYLENEKRYRNIISTVKPIYNLDSLRAAIEPKY